MNLRRMRPMMTFGKPHRMLPYNLWKGKFWISLCFNMAFHSSPSPFPWSIFLISRCKHWKYSGLDPNSVSIQIHTNFMQIWGCFANHQFGWTWRGRIMGSTFKLKMVDRRTKKAKLILVTIAITVGGVLFRASIPFSIENAKCRPILTYLGYLSYLGYLGYLSRDILFEREELGDVLQQCYWSKTRLWRTLPQWPRKRLTRSHM